MRRRKHDKKIRCKFWNGEASWKSGLCCGRNCQGNKYIRGSVIGLIFALVVLIFIIYMLFKPYKESNTSTTKVCAKAQNAASVTCRFIIAEVVQRKILWRWEVRRMHMVEFADESFLYGLSAIIFCVAVVGLSSAVKNKCKMICKKKSEEKNNSKKGSM